MLINNVKLAWHFYLQEHKFPHQRLLRWTQGILLLFIITLSQTSNSIQSYLHNNLQELLGADAVISQKMPFTTQQLTQASKITNNIVTTQHITTTLTHNGTWQKAKLKAVGEKYPLQGNLMSSASLLEKSQVSSTGPQKGHIWLDARLIASLSLNIGDYLTISNHKFLVSRVLHHEPDRLMEGHDVSMRAMINIQDIELLPFSADLIQHRYLIAANKQQINSLIEWQSKALPAAQIYHKQGAHPLSRFWQRTENFMGLASIILFFMAAIAIQQLTQVHMKRDQLFSAICLSLGADRSAGIQISIIKWLIGLSLVLPFILICSALCHWLIINWLNETFMALKWQWSMSTALASIAAVFSIFAIFHLPVWLSLYNSSVASLFRTDNNGINHWFSKLSSIIVLSTIAITYTDNALLTIMMVTSIIITIILIIFVSWSSLTLGEKLTQNISGLIPFTLFMMKQRLVSKSTQILGVGLCAFLLLFTLMLLKDLGASMSAYQRQHDGNLLVSQATKSQMKYIEEWANEKDIEIRQSKPYVYAKLLKINKQSLKEYSDQPSESLATFSNEIRLHWSESIPTNNSLDEGIWWQPNTTNWNQISIEQEVMTDLNLEIGDWLTFFIGQQEHSFQIVASHVFKSGNGSITFWVQMPPAAINHIKSTHYNMASIELGSDKWELVAPLWQKFPSLRMVSLKEMTERFDNTLAMITKVISGFSLMIMLLSSVVILASINALESKEKKKNSIIMSFGFTRKTCLNLNIIEWFVTASITATGAILGTYIAGQLIYQSQFSLTYKPDFMWLAITLTTILSLVAGLGIFASRKNLRSSVKQLMSET